VDALVPNVIWDSANGAPASDTEVGLTLQVGGLTALCGLDVMAHDRFTVPENPPASIANTFAFNEVPAATVCVANGPATLNAGNITETTVLPLLLV
jgi:hypothetical protein